MRIALLGATGFVGKNMAEVLYEHGIDFIPASKSTGVDLREVSQAGKFFSEVEPDFIINCAAHAGSLNYLTQQAADVILDNSRMILAMYEAVASVSPKSIIINPVANCAYPAKADILIEDEWWNGHLHSSVLSYGTTRRLLWAVGESFRMQHNLKSIYLLLPSMYGPYDSTDPNKAHALNALISKFVRAKISGDPVIPVWGTGVAIREWLYVKDFSRIVLEILNNPYMPGLSQPLNIGQNSGLSVRELVDVIKRSYEYEGQISWDHSKPDGTPKKVMSNGRFRKAFPTFEFTTLEAGITKTINFYSSVYPY